MRCLTRVGLASYIYGRLLSEIVQRPVRTARRQLGRVSCAASAALHENLLPPAPAGRTYDGSMNDFVPCAKSDTRSFVVKCRGTKRLVSRKVIRQPTVGTSACGRFSGLLPMAATGRTEPFIAATAPAAQFPDHIRSAGLAAGGS